MKSLQKLFLYNKRILYLIYKKNIKGVDEFYVKNKDFNWSEDVKSLIQELDVEDSLCAILNIIGNNYHLIS